MEKERQKELEKENEKLKEDNRHLKEEYEKFKIRTNYLIKSAKQLSKVIFNGTIHFLYFLLPISDGKITTTSQLRRYKHF